VPTWAHGRADELDEVHRRAGDEEHRAPIREALDDLRMESCASTRCFLGRPGAALLDLAQEDEPSRLASPAPRIHAVAKARLPPGAG